MLLLGSAVDFSEGFLQPIGGDEQNQRQGLTLAPAVIFKVQFLYRYNQRKRAQKNFAKNMEHFVPALLTRGNSCVIMSNGTICSKEKR